MDITQQITKVGQEADKFPKVFGLRGFPGKKFKISETILMSYEAVEAEFAKCDLLCPNCHARRHRLASEVE